MYSNSRRQSDQQIHDKACMYADIEWGLTYPLVSYLESEETFRVWQRMYNRGIAVLLQFNGK